MFSYFLSVALLFIVLGVVRNILAKVEPEWWLEFDFDEFTFLTWVIVFTLSLLWFIAIPVLFIALVLYLLKMLTDKIANVIINRINSKEKEDV